jgi:hypothetical protein
VLANSNVTAKQQQRVFAALEAAPREPRTSFHAASLAFASTDNEAAANMRRGLLDKSLVNKQRMDTVVFSIGGALFHAVALSCEQNSPVMKAKLSKLSNIYSQVIPMRTIANLDSTSMYEVRSSLPRKSFTSLPFELHMLVCLPTSVNQCMHTSMHYVNKCCHSLVRILALLCWGEQRLNAWASERCGLQAFTLACEFMYTGKIDSLEDAEVAANVWMVGTALMIHELPQYVYRKCAPRLHSPCVLCTNSCTSPPPH